MFKKFLIVALMAMGTLSAPVYASEAVDKVVDGARKDCASIENGVFKAGPEAITRVDLTGDGKDNELVDFSHFSCTSGASFYCGTGGCGLTAVVDGVATEFLAKAWKVVDWIDKAVLLLDVHGGLCGGTNLRSCVNALIWDGDSFHGVGKP